MRLIPRQEKFFEYFENAAKHICRGAEVFKEIVADFSCLQEKSKVMKDLEHECDLVTHATMEKLNKTFITPIDREDIHALCSSLDDVMDFLEATVNRMFAYDLEKFDEPMKKLIEVIGKQSEEIRKAVILLKNLKNVDKIMEHCVEINRLENEADTVNRMALSDLFRSEKDPIQIIKKKDIYGYLEEVTDKSEHIAIVIEGIVLKNA